MVGRMFFPCCLQPGLFLQGRRSAWFSGPHISHALITFKTQHSQIKRGEMSQLGSSFLWFCSVLSWLPGGQGRRKGQAEEAVGLGSQEAEGAGKQEGHVSTRTCHTPLSPVTTLAICPFQTLKGFFFFFKQCCTFLRCLLETDSSL